MPTENRSSNAGAPFQREERYIVIKRKDLDAVLYSGSRDPGPACAVVDLRIALEKLSASLPKRDCMVIESDWPEFEPAWAAIESRVTGKRAAQHQGEPVAWLYRDPDGNARDQMTDSRATEEDRGGWLEIPLYTHADPGEIDRLRKDLFRWKGIAETLQVDAAKLSDESIEFMTRAKKAEAEVERLRLELSAVKFNLDKTDKGLLAADSEIGRLRAQLAERDAQLRKVRDKLQEECWDRYAGLDETRDLLDAALSASAEPEAKS